MNEKREGSQSQMFTLRVWVEDVGNACAERQPEVASRSSRFEYRGTLKHVLTGETHHFRDWTTLTQLIETSMTTAQKLKQTNEID